MINSVQQKNLNDIITDGCLPDGIRRARAASIQIIDNLKATFDKRANAAGAKIDRQIDRFKANMQSSIDKTIAKEEKCIERNVQLMNEAREVRARAIEAAGKKFDDYCAKLHEKQAIIANETKRLKAEMREGIEKIENEESKKHNIRRGEGRRIYDHTIGGYRTEPGGWVITNDHPNSSALTNARAEYSKKIDSLWNDLEDARRRLWLAESRDEARIILEDLKKIRTSYEKILAKDPSSYANNL